MRTHRSALLLGALALGAGAVVAGSPSAGATAAETNCNYIADSARPTVHPGDKNNNVRQVQCLINFYSNYPTWIDVDGDYGQKTASGIFYVQTCNGTTGGADGIVGTSTWSRLYSPKAACAL
jgi:peptidoglycan hydrolase-like protein with peptidoglycan-binding domain